MVVSLLLLLLAAGCVEIPGCGFGVDFSPDGNQVAFTWVAGDELCLAIANTDGGRLRIVPGSNYPGPPLWSPDGRYLLFTSDTDLKLHDLASHSTRKIAAKVVPGAYVWSNDGTQVICITRHEASSEPDQIRWLSMPSGEVVFCTELPSDVKVRVPAQPTPVALPPWGIAFIDSNGNVVTVEAGKVYRITNTGDVTSLWASADGTRLRWVRSPEKSKMLVIHEYDLASRTVIGKPLRVDLRTLPHLPGYALTGAAGILSPGGERMLVLAAFERNTGRERQSYLAVYLTSLTRPGFVLLRQQAPRKQENFEGLMVPMWSRDGSRIAVLTIEKSCSLWVSRGDGSGGGVLREKTLK